MPGCGVMRYRRDEAAGSSNTSGSTDTNVWLSAWALLSGELRRSLWLIILFAILFGFAGFALRAVVPARYVATADLMIDPRGFQVFENDLTTGQYDANAAVNFVESQMHVITSATVLARAYRYAQGDVDGAENQTPVDPQAIDSLRRAVSISRAERSYILNISVRDSDPERAALLANSVVRAFLDEDASNREFTSGRLNSDLTARLEQLRERVAQSEAAVDQYNSTNNLVTVDGRLVVEHQLADAVRALSAAQERLSATQALADQQSGADVQSILSMTNGSDNAQILALLARRTAASEEIALLATRLGNQHPSLRSARNQAQEIDRLIDSEMNRIRSSGKAQLGKIKEERDNLAKTVQSLSEKSNELRSLSIGQRQLEQQLETDRALLASFELRARQTDEFGKVDSANMRLLSQAYPPPSQQGPKSALPWAIVGVILGVMFGIGLAVLRSLARFLSAGQRPPQLAIPSEPSPIEPPPNAANHAVAGELEGPSNRVIARERLLGSSAAKSK
jgi:succinoglycan biosynthesis transport protein ExoP